jgi:hypothetical protein
MTKAIQNRSARVSETANIILTAIKDGVRFNMEARGMNKVDAVTSVDVVTIMKEAIDEAIGDEGYTERQREAFTHDVLFYCNEYRGINLKLLSKTNTRR